MSKYDSGTPGVEQVSWYLGHLAGGYLRFTVCDQPWGPEKCTGADTDDPVLNEGCWNLVAATYDTVAREAKIYVDNVEVPSTANLAGTVALIADSEAPVHVGTFTPASGDKENFWGGLIDELEIYNRALSESEIAGIYNAGASGKCKPDPAQ